MTEQNVSNQRERGSLYHLLCPALLRESSVGGWEGLGEKASLTIYVDVTFYLAEAQTAGADA